MPDFFHTGEFYSLLCAVIWAFGVIMFRVSGLTVPPVPLNLFKGAVALLLLVPTMLIRGTSFVPARLDVLQWGQLMLSGVVGIAVADSIFFASLNRLGAAANAIVSCLYSPFVVLLAVVFLGEPLTVHLVLAAALMASGILLGTSRAALRATSAADRADRTRGITYGLLSAALMAVGINLAKPVLGHADVLWSTAVRLLGAVLFLGVQGLLPAHRAVVWRIFTSVRQWRWLLPASVVGTYLAMMAWLAGMKYTHASISSVLNQTSTLLIPLLAWLLLRERMTWRIAAGALLGFAGAAILACRA